jgi:methyl-accepting chemotaxis protein
MKLLANARIGVKVALAPLVAMLCLLVVAALGLLANRDLTASLRGMKATTLPSLAVASGLQLRVAKVYAGTNQSFSWQGAKYPEARIDALDNALTVELAAIDKALKEQASASLWSEAEKAEIVATHKAFALFRRAALDAIDMKSSGLAQAAAFMDQMQDAYDKLEPRIAALAKQQSERAVATVDTSTERAVNKGLGIAAGAGLALLCVALAVWWCSRLIVRPLREAQGLAAAVAQGDLSVRAASARADETGRLLSALQDTARELGRVVDEVRDTASQVDTAADEIAQGNADLSQRTEQQAARLQQTSGAIDQVTEGVRRNATSADQADSLAREAREVAHQGEQAVGEVVVTMDGLATQARRISEIIGTIDGIAFQTNILALNAAVEAARAGEQGRGFAVVAGEVRTLAQRSAEAAREIRSLIASSVEQTEAGTARVQAAGQTMQRTVIAIQRVSDVMSEIASACRGQADDVARVNASVADMDQSTQQNAALVEQASAAAESLRMQSRRLIELLGRFRTAG